MNITQIFGQHYQIVYDVIKQNPGITAQQIKTKLTQFTRGELTPILSRLENNNFLDSDVKKVPRKYGKGMREQKFYFIPGSI